MKLRGLLLLIFITVGTFSFAQQLLHGTIYDEMGIPVPFAKVYVKNSSELRTIADANGYYEMRLFQGEYFLVVRSAGYEEQEAIIPIVESTVTLLL